MISRGGDKSKFAYTFFLSKSILGVPVSALNTIVHI